MNRAPRVLCVGDFSPGSLEGSYAAAFATLGCDVQRYDLPGALAKVERLGALGRVVDRFLPVVTWSIKANRDLILLARRLAPDLVVVFGANRITVGALAHLHAQGGIKLVLVWPDSLAYLDWVPVETFRLYDLVASFTKAALPVFESLGAARVEWVPLAGDPGIHGRDETGARAAADELAADVSFIGGWRPERAALLEVIATRLPRVRLKVWGPEWGRRTSRGSALRKAWQGRSLVETEYAVAVRASSISLNPIDPLNYPAANMRFFEIPTAGGLQLASACPEMSEEFPDGVAGVYYDDIEQVPSLIEALLGDPARRERIAACASERVRRAHTYGHRATQILASLGVPMPGEPAK